MIDLFIKKFSGMSHIIIKGNLKIDIHEIMLKSAGGDRFDVYDTHWFGKLSFGETALLEEIEAAIMETVKTRYDETREP